MGRAFVVYESMFGNNQQLATAIADGIREAGREVESVEVGEAPHTLPVDISLLIVGSPNHAMGMPRPSGRADAAKRTPNPLVSTGISLREWFDELPHVTAETPAAAWDSRLAKPRFLRLLDRAARGIEKRLRSRGLRIAAPAEHFSVESTTGPLAPGELERAQRWGAELASLIPLSQPAHAES